METDFKIENNIITVDINSTIEFYKSQNKIIDDCNCQDCSYYANIFINQPFKIYNTLNNMGVDISKNLNSEPTGVQCIRDSNDDVINISQIYQITGKIIPNSLNNIKCSVLENGLNFNLFFLQSSENKIDIELDINKV